MWDKVNRRKFARAEYPCLITVRKNTAPVQAVLTHTEDLSTVGVRVLIRKEIVLNTEVDLEVDLKDTLESIFSKGTIMWVRKIAAKKGDKAPRYNMGIGFIGLKSEDKARIQKIVDHLAKKTHKQ